MRALFKFRGWISLVTAALLVATAYVIYGAFRYNWRYGLPTHDKTVVVNTVFAACALGLVGWGVIVALAAYISATGSPNLSFEITFNFSYPNKPVFKAHVGFPEPGAALTAEPFKQLDGRVVIRNRSKYAARNPGVLIEFKNCSLPDPPDLGEWRKVSTGNMVGVTSIQWDGGANYIIHGRWRRTLPPLDFRSLAAYSCDSHLLVSIAADGFDPHEWKVPVKILGPVEYDRYMKNVVSAASKKNPLPGPPPASP